MDIREMYQSLYTAVLAEHAEVFRNQDIGEIEELMDLIIRAERLFIMVNGSGEIGHIAYTQDQAEKTGAKTAVITGSPQGRCPAKADFTLFVPAAVYKGTDPRVVPSIQPMGNLFEQHLFLLFDIIVMLLEKKTGLTHEEMESRHRNIE